MAVAERNPILGVLEGAQAEATTAFMQFFGEVCAIPAVRLIGALQEEKGEPVLLWAVMSEDDEEQQERIYLALQDYLRSDGPNFDLRVVTPRLRSWTLPNDAVTLYHRA